MKVLIAVVMFLLGIFIGILIVPTFKEFSDSMYAEEEYSSDRIDAILRDFGITSIPPDASHFSLFMKQDGEKKELWLKFNCPAGDKAAFIEELSSRHAGRFNEDVPPVPKTQDGSAVTWWAYNSASGKNEFSDLCVAYDDFARCIFLYAVSGFDASAFVPSDPDSDADSD